MQQLELKRKNADHLLLSKPKRSDYKPKHLIRGEAVVYDADTGNVVVRLVANAVDPMDCEVGYRWLKSVDGALSARASVLGTKLVPRVRRDGSKGRTMIVDPEIVERARRDGARADFLGFWENEPRNQFCRQTAWTRKNPEVLLGVMPLIRAADCILKVERPEAWQRQHDHVSKAPDFCIEGTDFSTLTVNRNLSTTYHRDQGDYKEGFGVMLTLGNFTGGYLCFPEYGLAVDYRPGDILLADVHCIHGNFPIEGDRIACVLYARDKISQCGSLEEEWQKAKAKVGVFQKIPQMTPEERAEFEREKAARMAKNLARREKNKFPKITIT